MTLIYKRRQEVVGGSRREGGREREREERTLYYYDPTTLEPEAPLIYLLYVNQHLTTHTYPPLST